MDKMKTQIRVRADYRCYPVWVETPLGIEDHPPEEFEVPHELAVAIVEWADRYEQTYQPLDPLSSKFPSREAEVAFYVDGLALARDFAASLGDRFDVYYYDGRIGSTYRV